MNITDLIVELLKQGQRVELPGMGTLGSTLQGPRHDQARGLYYPSMRIPVFDTATTGDESIVAILAERECVSTDVARQMWKNYMDALGDKLRRTGSHTFGELGTLRFADGQGHSFEVADGLMISVGDEKPIENVRTYAHDDEDDPFARFYAEAAKEEPPAPVAPAPAPVEPEPVAPESEPEPVVPEPEPAPAEPEPASAEPEPVVSEPEPARLPETDPDLVALEELPPAPEPKPGKAKKEKKRKDKGAGNNKKKGLGWWWLLIIVLLLALLGGGAYYMLAQRSSAAALVAPGERAHLSDVPAANSLTYNYDLLEYEQRDIAANRNRLCSYMAPYIDNFLAYRHYTGARVPMMERVQQYAGERLSVLMDDRFSVQRLIPHNDYIYNHIEPFMRQHFADSMRYTVQGELLDMRLLDNMLDQLIAELGLEPDANLPVAAQLPAERRRAEAPVPANVKMEQDSRLGFDIIAGFYLDRATAARLTARLHELGSDAYIIEKNNMYYVSMGSAKDRTSAEALFKHIKGWYDGDVAIKQW